MKKKIYSLMLLFLSVMMVAACSLDGLTASISGTKITEVSSKKTSAAFEVRMLNVGQGLSILIKANGKYMLYDGGGRDYSSYVVSYLKKHNIKKLDYLVASHYDDDHINGLVGVLATTKVNKVLDPGYKADSSIYTSFQSKLKKNGAKVVHPSRGDKYTLGKAKITVVGPKNYKSENENSRSICLRITYGNFSVLLTGDAQEDAETAMRRSGLTLKSTLYIVGHHGSSTSSSASFVKKVAPKYGFISVGKNNKYGHPTSKTLGTLNKYGVKIYRTDTQGEVTAYTDGSKVWFSEKASTSNKAGSTTTKTTTTSSSKYTGKYVLNTSSKKFHKSTCSGVKKMSSKNKKYSSKSRAELIKAGYKACGICKP